jgi:hypothetical protein
MIIYGLSGIIPWDYNYYEDMIELSSVRDEEAKNIYEVTSKIYEEETMLY